MFARVNIPLEASEAMADRVRSESSGEDFFAVGRHGMLLEERW